MDVPKPSTYTPLFRRLTGGERARELDETRQLHAWVQAHQPSLADIALVIGRSVYLIALRKEGGVHQSVLAERLGKPQQFVSKVENRQRRLDVVEFYAWVRALGGDPTEAITQVYQQLPKDASI